MGSASIDGPVSRPDAIGRDRSTSLGEVPLRVSAIGGGSASSRRAFNRKSRVRLDTSKRSRS